MDFKRFTVDTGVSDRLDANEKIQQQNDKDEEINKLITFDESDVERRKMSREDTKLFLLSFD